MNLLLSRNLPSSSVFTDFEAILNVPYDFCSTTQWNTNPAYSVLFTLFIDKGHPSFVYIFRTVLGWIVCGSFQSLRTFHHQRKWYQVTVLIFLLWTELEVQTTIEESSIQLYSYFNSYYSFCEVDWFFSWNFLCDEIISCSECFYSMSWISYHSGAREDSKNISRHDSCLIVGALYSFLSETYKRWIV